MIRKTISLALVVMLGVMLLYLSRFWYLSLWPREGLFGLGELRPQGGLLSVWLRGTDLAPFELLIWAVGLFVILTWVQKLFDRIGSKADDH